MQDRGEQRQYKNDDNAKNGGERDRRRDVVAVGADYGCYRSIAEFPQIELPQAINMAKRCDKPSRRAIK
jgi:hypothetical protein